MRKTPFQSDWGLTSLFTGRGLEYQPRRLATHSLDGPRHEERVLPSVERTRDANTDYRRAGDGPRGPSKMIGSRPLKSIDRRLSATLHYIWH